ncbi:MAG: hypothetical protein JRI79_07045 [Deltaproteobacteria bacterium]|nr:hypothetical protein [Deltaproteobacteria bacterium]MBW1934577.1 hypothetical protein [Deltaproteobacteria bacterium]MBW1977709.1 hypothetical protein [Deltaproteobacteria bacterium]MBW2043423.1 hypothetical protein [Deltaproteobacteria bacterium]MBW2299457.1 hypothetical protein [Deltaproteobacteria bacterium]
MADYCINVFLDDEQLKKVEDAGLGEHVEEIGGKKAVKVAVGPKEQKKLLKAFPDLEFDSSNACVLPDDAQQKLLEVITTSKTLDCMKVAIVKLYNPLAGKAPRSKVY